MENKTEFTPRENFTYGFIIFVSSIVLIVILSYGACLLLKEDLKIPTGATNVYYPTKGTVTYDYKCRHYKLKTNSVRWQLVSDTEIVNCKK